MGGRGDALGRRFLGTRDRLRGRHPRRPGGAAERVAGGGAGVQGRGGLRGGRVLPGAPRAEPAREQPVDPGVPAPGFLHLGERGRGHGAVRSGARGDPALQA